jgi:three-Cys-motif partner protein
MVEQADRPVVGPWAADKLDRLTAYLKAYATALKNKFRLVYIDAFAGAGSAYVRMGDADEDDDLPVLFRLGDLDEEERQVLDGSPRVALKTNPPFDVCVFIELDSERRHQLEQLKEAYPERDVRVHASDCKEYLERLISNSDVDWRRWRGIVFLDPFGMTVPWKTIEGLARTRALEVIINFPLGMAIHRVLPRVVEKASIRRFMKHDIYFGDLGWFDEVYRPQNDLFRGQSLVKRDDAGDRLLTWYRHRLKRAFGHVSPAYPVKNSRGVELYNLIWAGPHPLGLKIAADVLSQEKAARRQIGFAFAALRRDE